MFEPPQLATSIWPKESTDSFYSYRKNLIIDVATPTISFAGRNYANPDGLQDCYRICTYVLCSHHLQLPAIMIINIDLGPRARTRGISKM